ncbi:AAA family ATPase [Allobaculum sp. Allo2]|uniref:AAA family ATPase n=1 Tax=Allobaculum sp. Allo2 TaxID=2853432 RepID=UPI001F6063AC|nr:AAA family ATPase [Allobaculum sp. Allo2]UNT94215.1 AAA family ATPase [Allobaculum sp. Allo2]
MFLKRIELSGYKSFANRSVLNFEEPLTGIVGPNGCGKSNITDAVRFALGEQSAKSLRSGSSLNEMIFAGSQSRKPVNIARVTLVFDNSQKIFDSPMKKLRSPDRFSADPRKFSTGSTKRPAV